MDVASETCNHVWMLSFAFFSSEELAILKHGYFHIESPPSLELNGCMKYNCGMFIKWTKQN